MKRTSKHATPNKRNAFTLGLKIVAASVVTLLASGAALAAVVVNNVTKSFTVVQLEDSIDSSELPPIGASDSEISILFVGSDMREEKANSNSLNDVTMLLHIPKDRSGATIVSFPRDMIVPIPSCPTGDGGYHSAMSGQPINVTLSYGGLPCTVLTVEALTGMDIPYAAMTTFNGAIRMSNAVGGVDVCVSSPIRDPQSNLYLDPGTHNIQGEEALAFMRTRKGVGDGSDLGRIGMQQAFLSSLIRTVKSNDTLTDINKLYSLANVAAQSTTVSDSLTGLDTMVSLALVLKDLDMSKISFITYPGTTGSKEHPGKVIPNRALGDELFELIREGKPVVPQDNNTGVGTSIIENADSDTEKPSTDADTDEKSGGTKPNDQSANTPDDVTVLPDQIKGQTADKVACAQGR